MFMSRTSPQACRDELSRCNEKLQQAQRRVEELSADLEATKRVNQRQAAEQSQLLVSSSVLLSFGDQLCVGLAECELGRQVSDA